MLIRSVPQINSEFIAIAEFIREQLLTWAPQTAKAQMIVGKLLEFYRSVVIGDPNAVITVSEARNRICNRILEQFQSDATVANTLRNYVALDACDEPISIGNEAQLRSDGKVFDASDSIRKLIESVDYNMNAKTETRVTMLFGLSGSGKGAFARNLTAQCVKAVNAGKTQFS